MGPVCNSFGVDLLGLEELYVQLFEELPNYFPQLSFDPAILILLLGIYLEDTHPTKQKYIGTRLLAAIPFVTDNMRNNFNVHM